MTQSPTENIKDFRSFDAKEITSLDFKQMQFFVDCFKNCNFKINQIDANTFISFESLKYLDLSNNVLVELDPRVLSPLLNLEKLSLCNNQLKELRSGTFDALENLKELILAINLITNLRKNIFESLKKLERLNFNSNKLIELDLNTFLPLNNLKNLSLINNPLSPTTIAAIKEKMPFTEA